MILVTGSVTAREDSFDEILRLSRLGEKRTSIGGQDRPVRSRMTRSGRAPVRRN
jgi:hypothetical protein